MLDARRRLRGIRMGSDEPIGARDRQGCRQDEHEEGRVEVEADEEPEDGELGVSCRQHDDADQPISQ